MATTEQINPYDFNYRHGFGAGDTTFFRDTLSALILWKHGVASATQVKTVHQDATTCLGDELSTDPKTFIKGSLFLPSKIVLARNGYAPDVDGAILDMASSESLRIYAAVLMLRIASEQQDVFNLETMESIAMSKRLPTRLARLYSAVITTCAPIRIAFPTSTDLFGIIDVLTREGEGHFLGPDGQKEAKEILVSSERRASREIAKPQTPILHMTPDEITDWMAKVIQELGKDYRTPVFSNNDSSFQDMFGFSPKTLHILAKRHGLKSSKKLLTEAEVKAKLR